MIKSIEGIAMTESHWASLFDSLGSTMTLSAFKVFSIVPLLMTLKVRTMMQELPFAMESMV